jgi:tetratricopeptide (TPR) repeat protein
MNKLIYVLSVMLFLVSGALKAQTTSGTPSSSYGSIESKLKKSDANLTDSDKTVKPKFWISRAENLMDAYEINRKFLIPGTAKVQVKLMFLEPKETKTWQEKGGNYEQFIYDRVNVILKDGVVESFEETKPLYDNPLPQAYKALVTAQEKDIENKSKKDIKTDYDRLKMDFNQFGVEQFSKKDYEASFNSFAALQIINDKPIMDGVVDTTALYNAGLAAINAKKNNEAIKFFELAKKVNHPEPNLYVLLEQSYLEVGDSAKGIAVLEEGFKRFPSSQGLQVELINYFLNKQESEKALNYLKVAQQSDPKNMSFIFAEGTLYDKMGDSEKAVATYKRCFEIDPNFYDAFYNIGVVYFNKAVKLYEEAAKIDIKNQKEYEAAQQVADDELGKSVQYMEKAHELNPTDVGTMKTLKTIYIRLHMNDKKDAIDKELEQVQ